MMMVVMYFTGEYIPSYVRLFFPGSVEKGEVFCPVVGTPVFRTLSPSKIS